MTTIKVSYPSPYISYISGIYRISVEAEQFINRETQLVQISKGEILVSAGDLCKNIYLIGKGVLRGFIKAGSEEITTWIASEYQLTTCISSVGIQKPSKESIQAVEDCDLYALSYDTLECMYHQFPETNILSRKILEKFCRMSEDRMLVGRLPRMAMKYEHFVATRGELTNRVPLKLVASYLGMKVETLSRIRRELSQNRNSV